MSSVSSPPEFFPFSEFKKEWRNEAEMLTGMWRKDVLDKSFSLFHVTTTALCLFSDPENVEVDCRSPCLVVTGRGGRSIVCITGSTHTM